MRGWVILTITLVIGVLIGVGVATRGPAFIAPYLPKAVRGANARIEGQVVRKQRDGNRLLVKVDTAQGPMLVVFTDKSADLDVLLDPGDTVTLLTGAGYATFVNDPTLERVQRPARTGAASAGQASSGSPTPPVR
jgi:hypothetical protein